MSAGHSSTPRLPALKVIGAGARTSLGFDLASSAAAARAGLTAFADHPFMIDSSGLPMAVARDAELALDLERVERLARLAAAAAQDAFEQLQPHAARLPLMILLALPRAGDAAGPVEPAVIAQAIQDALGDRASVVTIRASHAGHVAGIAAAQAAAQAAAEGFDGHCLLLGVDTWLDAATLEWLDETELLAVRARPFGLVPGEAAAALLLAPRSAMPSERTRATIECGERVHGRTHRKVGSAVTSGNHSRRQAFATAAGLDDEFARVGRVVQQQACALAAGVPVDREQRLDPRPEVGDAGIRISHGAGRANACAPAAAHAQVRLDLDVIAIG